jgi:hypothetical protein
MKLTLTTIFLTALLAFEANAEETQVLLKKQRPVRRNHNYAGTSTGSGTIGTHSAGQSKGSYSTGSKQSGGTSNGVGTSGATSTGSKGSGGTASKGSSGSSSKGSDGGGPGGIAPVDTPNTTPVPIRAPGAPNLSNDPYKNPGRRQRRNRK